MRMTWLGRLGVALAVPLVAATTGCGGGSPTEDPVFFLPEPVPDFTPTPPPDPLPMPVQLGPPDGSVFEHPHPRTFTLEWTAVPGATLYHVDLEVCQNPSCAGTAPELVFPWKPPLYNLTETSVTRNFVGAQPGRWRVWATGEGRSSPKTGWWEFRFTR